MDFNLFLQAVLALAFVIGLLLVFFWLIKLLQQKGIGNPFLRKVKLSSRLKVVESKRIDARNVLVLARCDDEEFLLLLGSSQSVVLQNKKVKENV